LRLNEPAMMRNSCPTQMLLVQTLRMRYAESGTLDLDPAFIA
jgi:hypothetical protein